MWLCPFYLPEAYLMHFFHRTSNRISVILALATVMVAVDGRADGLVEVGTQPAGGFSEKVVYIHGGHGYTADNLGDGAWSSQRGNLLGMVEALGNVDQMTFL